MKRKYPEKVSDNLLLKVLAMNNPVFAAHYAEQEVLEAWNKILGENLLAYTQSFQFADGAIRVRITSPALRNELYMQRTQLIEKINAAIGNQLVFAIVFI